VRREWPRLERDREIKPCCVSGLTDVLGRKELDRSRPPPGLFLDLPRCSSGTVLARIDIATWDLPVPPVHDEPVPPDQQQALPWLVENHGHRASRHSGEVLLELLPIRKLNTGHRQADVRVRIH
jgi:hypothetical protein